MAATATLDAQIRTDAKHAPSVTSARVLLSHLYLVVNVQS
jgi:hypothetical protein